ncbi:MAG: hypothetical protein AAF662_04495 [Pseudomonadota bacterium]
MKSYGTGSHSRYPSKKMDTETLRQIVVRIIQGTGWASATADFYYHFAYGKVAEYHGCR